jgi:hypothetical protein
VELGRRIHALSPARPWASSAHASREACHWDPLVRPGAAERVSEEKYRALAEAIERQDWSVRTLNFHPACIAGLDSEAKACDALLVWINPIEPGLDRAELDEFLRRVAAQGVLVSAHPDAILKIGTKDVLVETQSVGWTVDARSYGDVREFASLFPRAVREKGHRVLKQYRGNGGQGVWKVSAEGEGFAVLSAARDASPVRMSQAELEAHFAPVFDHGGHLIDQAWVATLPRGMIRAYLCGTKVAGFGYQEVNALHPPDPLTGVAPPPSTRHYYTESCALFQSLRTRLESHWLPRAAAALEMPQENFPLLWDADFLLADPPQDYVLCEINASCVSPFPPSAIRPMIAALGVMLAAR